MWRQVGRTFSVRSERVRPAPQPPSRELVPLPPPKGRPLAPGGKFTLLTYNLLADLYATVRAATCMQGTCNVFEWFAHWMSALAASVLLPMLMLTVSRIAGNFTPWHVQNEQFPYCQSWVLGWQYRKQNLLKELLGYSADIVCLQEV